MRAHVKAVILTIVFITGWYGVQTAKAEPRLSVAAGTVIHVDPELAKTIRLGDRFVLQYVFDPETPDLFPANPSLGVYPAVRSLSVTVGAYAATARGGDILVRNDWYGLDAYEVSSNVGLHGLSGPGISGFSLASASLKMEDHKETGFASDELPMIFPKGDDFDHRYLELRFEDDLGIPRVVIATSL